MNPKFPSELLLSPALLIIAGIVWTVLLLLALLLFALISWPGEPDPEAVHDSSQVYGETVRWGARIRQPWSTWSDLGFIILGLVALVISAYGGEHPANPLQGPTLASLFFGLLFIYLGPGSMYFHAGLTRWGGVLDGISLSAFMCFLFCYDLWWVAHWSGPVVILLWGAIIAGIVVVIWFKDSYGKIFFAAWLGLTALLEVLIETKVLGSGHERNPIWLVPAAVCFGAAFLVWMLSQKGRLLFAPSAPMPGHAWWHLGCALAVFFLYFYFRSDGRS